MPAGIAAGTCITAARGTDTDAALVLQTWILAMRYCFASGPKVALVDAWLRTVAVTCRASDVCAYAESANRNERVYLVIVHNPQGKVFGH
jgi:hypothetical protein